MQLGGACCGVGLEGVEWWVGVVFVGGEIKGRSCHCSCRAGHLGRGNVEFSDQENDMPW